MWKAYFEQKIFFRFNPLVLTIYPDEVDCFNITELGSTWALYPRWTYS